MKISMVIPSYWARDSKSGWKEGDAIYDHPTPIDKEGTLQRIIMSIDKLKDKDFQLIIIAVPVAEDIGLEVEQRVVNIIKPLDLNMDVLIFGSSHIKKIHGYLTQKGKKNNLSLIQFRGYSNIRNLCMFLPHILGSEVVVLIDDDELFDDPDFMLKAKEFIGRDFGGDIINAVAGYYLQPDGGYHIKKSFRPWMRYWDQFDKMNQAFDKIIGLPPRLKETPFVFGGNMVIHRDLFSTVPFDPHVPRGEDIDFLINARMFGFSFFLDNQLSIKHLPPPKMHPVWRRLREDIYRFTFECAKIRGQKDIHGMKIVSPEDFDPYPGVFLKDDLYEKIYQSSKMLAIEYLSEGNLKDAEEALNNIIHAREEAIPEFDPFQNLIKLQKQWQELMEYTSKTEVCSEIRDIILSRHIR